LFIASSLFFVSFDIPTATIRPPFSYRLWTDHSFLTAMNRCPIFHLSSPSSSSMSSLKDQQLLGCWMCAMAAAHSGPILRIFGAHSAPILRPFGAHSGPYLNILAEEISKVTNLLQIAFPC
jgi:hypothetical protein